MAKAVKLVEMNKISVFDRAKEIYAAGRASWAINMIEQEVLRDKYTSLSDEDKEDVHVFLYEGGLKNSSSEKELFDKIDEFLDKQAERE